MEYSDFFDEDGWLKDEYLWPLRQEITLGSMYVSDYNNSFGIKPEKVCDFFTSFGMIIAKDLLKKTIYGNRLLF